MGEGTAIQPQTRRRRIIERPRLTRLLDESQGRIKMLVAPAGYGKTTLARQWLEGKTAAWYVGTPSCVDIAVLAAGLKRAGAEVLPGAGDALIDRIRVTGRPEDEADVLAGMLVGIQSNTVIWKHPDATGPVHLKIPLISELQVKAESRTHNTSTNACVIRLTNDDQLEGELVSLDNSQIT